MSYANHTAIHQALDAAPALLERGLGVSDLMTLISLARHLGKDEPTCWVSYSGIAQECLFSRGTAMRSVARLQKHGFVSVTEDKGSSNDYRVNFQPLPTSGTMPPPPVTPCDSPVTPCDSTSHTMRPEVVQGSNTVSSSVSSISKVVPATPVEDETMSDQRISNPLQVTQKPETGKSNSPAKGEERLLTNLYFEHLGSPDRLAGKLASEWPNTFGKLLRVHPYADLKAVIDWAFLTDTFWPSRLKGVRKVDPVAYFEEKLPTLLANSCDSRRKTDELKTGRYEPPKTGYFADWTYE